MLDKVFRNHLFAEQMEVVGRGYLEKGPMEWYVEDPLFNNVSVKLFKR